MLLTNIKSLAFEKNSVNINAGLGLFSTRGALGFSVEKFFNPNHAVVGALGIDLIGTVSSFGYRYFTDKLNQSDAVWDKCFFYFECDSHMYFGGAVQYSSKSKMTVKDGALEREYETDAKWLGLTALGFRDVFKNNLTFDLEISYRSIFKGGQYRQISGSLNDDTKGVEAGYRSLGYSVGLGYLF